MSTEPCRDCGRAGKFIQAFGLCRGCYSRWKRHTDPKRAARDREVSRRWKAAHREQNQARDRERSANPDYRGTCTACGELMGIGQRNDGICRPCQHRRVDKRSLYICSLWADGLKLGEIAALLGWSSGRLGKEMSRMREAGYDLPYRRTTEQRERMVANRRQVAA